jgi:hypothetical protein
VVDAAPVSVEAPADLEALADAESERALSHASFVQVLGWLFCCGGIGSAGAPPPASRSWRC